MPSLPYVLVRWFSTVRWVTNSARAICLFVFPSAASCAIRSSLGVSASRPRMASRLGLHDCAEIDTIISWVETIAGWITTLMSL